jgi:apolipoprotein D and lipocalin family protein
MFKSLAFAGLFLAGNSFAQVPPQTVKSLDVQAYAGRWYQIADYVQPYEMICKDCTQVIYTPQADGSIQIENQSRNKILGIFPCKITGSAVAPNPSEPGQLKVSFPIPIPVPSYKPEADYWILEVGDKNDQGLYNYAIVSNAKKSSFFILARTSSIDESLYNSLVQKYNSLGFDGSKIVKSNQAGCANTNPLLDLN